MRRALIAALTTLISFPGILLGRPHAFVNSPMESLERSPEPESDLRMYVPHPEGWKAHIKQTWDREYCFMQHPGQNFFHLLQCGEIYIEKNKEMYCLLCAVRLGIITHDRFFWQNAERPSPAMPN